jgi:RNA polymerase sigma-70 factor (ECF subfamily)
MINQSVIDALKMKNEKAFEYVYHQTKRGVYTMIFSIVKSHPATEDIMQDVYMKMMKSIDQYQNQTNFNNWIVTIAKYQAIDYYRKEKKNIHFDLQDYDALFSDQEPTPAQQTQFELMVNSLNEDQRSVILLKIADDMKFKDIALVLDKPLNTVIWLYHEALKVLKKI